MSPRRARQRRRRHQGGAARALFFTLGVLFAAAIIAGLVAIGYVVSIANSAPNLSSLTAHDPGRNSIVYAANGKQLAIIQNNILRFPISEADMPQTVRDATVAIEDQRFYQHKGIDYEGVLRAALKNLFSGKTLQGGSTLTMQLVRTLYISDERTYKRKIREAKLAEELENVHPGRAGKDWILTQYLNSVPYGTNNGGQQAVGIQAAARVYFDKPASRLTLAESALLAGLPQAPSQYNPFRDEGAALRRRNAVLDAMAKQGYITEGQMLAAQAEPLGTKRNGFVAEKREAYFVDYVVDELNKIYGPQTVRNGGLRIKTTIDLDMQSKARASIAQDLSFSGAPSSAIVSIDPATGYIRAMASSAKYADSKFNLAADAKRQPGSSFKVMALVAAVREGINPETTFYSSRRLKFDDPKWGPIDVQTYGHDYVGSISLVRATLRSDNTVYEQLALDVGPPKVKQAAEDLGITSRLEGVPAETLGGLANCCSPLEMADAYATIADGGFRNKPKAILQVKFPSGKVDDLSKPERVRAFDPAAMYEVTKILQDNIKEGTGVRANIGCPAAGKTGTTDHNTDAWFVGFTPHLATSTWVGFPRGKIPMGPLFHGANVDGGTFPAQIWGRYMKSVRRGFCGGFPKPPDKFVTKHPKLKYANGGGFVGTAQVTVPQSTTTPSKKNGGGGNGNGNGASKFDATINEGPAPGSGQPRPSAPIQLPSTPSTGDNGTAAPPDTSPPASGGAPAPP